MAITHHHSSFPDRPRSGGAAVAFLIVIAVTLIAFHVTAAGVFYEPPTVRIHAGSQLAAPPQILTDHPQIDETAKMSIAKPESRALRLPATTRLAPSTIAASTHRTVPTSHMTARAVSAGGRERRRTLTSKISWGNQLSPPRPVADHPPRLVAQKAPSVAQPQTGHWLTWH